jgi:DNA-binding ferritin-like protein
MVIYAVPGLKKQTMLDPQVDAVRLMANETAERIAALGSLRTAEASTEQSAARRAAS